jgi:hypothetical protein
MGDDPMGVERGAEVMGDTKRRLPGNPDQNSVDEELDAIDRRPIRLHFENDGSDSLRAVLRRHETNVCSAGSCSREGHDHKRRVKGEEKE